MLTIEGIYAGYWRDPDLLPAIVAPVLLASMAWIYVGKFWTDRALKQGRMTFASIPIGAVRSETWQRVVKVVIIGLAFGFGFVWLPQTIAVGGSAAKVLTAAALAFLGSAFVYFNCVLVLWVFSGFRFPP